jgi:hypothetical protein
LIVGLAKFIWTTCCERNRHSFQKNTSRTPTSAILVSITQIADPE